MLEPINKGYLYVLFSGVLTIEEGEVHDYIHQEHLGTFRTKSKKRLTSLYPNVVYRSTVWLIERDDDLATKLILDDEENSILLLEEKIINHRIKIQNIKNELVVVYKEV